MDSISQNKMLCKFKNCAQKLSSMKLEDDLDLSLRMTADDEGERKVFFNKSIKSKTELSLLKALGAMLAIGVCIWALCFLWALCSIFKKK